MSLNVRVITPDRVVWDASTEELILPSSTGQLGILKEHAPLLTALDIGVVRLRTGTKWVSIVLMEGFAEVENNKVTILCNGAEEAASIDVAKTQADLERITAEIDQATTPKEKIDATIHYAFDCTELYEALRCDNINGQRLNLYKFEGGGSTLKITVGDPHLGQTTTTLTDKTWDESKAASPKWECEFDGGLDDLFKHFHGECLISIFDFTRFGQGYRMLINFNNGSWAFHAALLKN